MSEIETEARTRAPNAVRDLSTDKIGIIEPRPAAPEGGAADPAPAQFVVLVHPDRRRLGQRFWIEPGRSLEAGRSSRAVLSFDDVLSVSREHARLRHQGGVVSIEDLGSTNGTFVNDQPARGVVALRDGDRIQMGGVHLRFLQSAEPERAYQATVHEVVVRDGLTELLQADALLAEANREVARAVRHGRPLSLAILEVEGFDRLDRDFGRLCGDFVLRRLARLARERWGAEEAAGRTGPAEFAWLLVETGEAAAWNRMLAFAVEVDRLPFECAGMRVPARLAVGVAALAPGLDAAGLLRAARAARRSPSPPGGAGG